MTNKEKIWDETSAFGMRLSTQKPMQKSSEKLLVERGLNINRIKGVQAS